MKEETFSGIHALTATRRNFIKALAFFAAAAHGGGSTAFAAYPDPPVRLRFLTPMTHAIISAFAHRILPPGGAFPEGALCIDVVQYFDAVIAAEPYEIQQDIKRGLILLEFGPYLQLKFRRFTRMTPAQKDAYLKTWEQSDTVLQRGVFSVFKKICCLGFFSSEKIFSCIGYDGPWA
ncbi:MAG: gluconate 2-dehydrogenase subunit 3 family protein [Deltaproteobacteria bacterium]|nr:gluconate 2-dehydrogenase subunit 3 family protein [Deltaproteobacteria bacterium]